jgi:hypothetical protein
LVAAARQLPAQTNSAPGKSGQATPSSAGSGVEARAERGDKSNQPAPAQRGGLTPAREAAAMTFVRQHHAELIDLLLYLKKQKPAAYDQAVLDLFRASERLAQQREQNYERYELDLAIWKTESRIELLSARLKMAGRDSPEGESLIAQLRKLLEEGHDLRAQRLELARQNLSERVEKLDRQLESMAATREQAIDRELQRLSNPPQTPVRAQKRKGENSSPNPQSKDPA